MARRPDSTDKDWALRVECSYREQRSEGVSTPALPTDLLHQENLGPIAFRALKEAGLRIVMEPIPPLPRGTYIVPLPDAGQQG